MSLVHVLQRHSNTIALLRGFKFDGQEAWEEGNVYDPKSGKGYDRTMKIDDKGNLAVRGFIGISLIGRTEIWQRAPKSP